MAEEIDKVYVVAERRPLNMKIARIKRGLTQREVADAVGVTQATYSRMENGVTRPDYNVLVKISKVLDVSVNRLTLKAKL
jgi:transcriptional regulator with XRE-family HTH domain